MCRWNSILVNPPQRHRQGALGAPTRSARPQPGQDGRTRPVPATAGAGRVRQRWPPARVGAGLDRLHDAVARFARARGCNHPARRSIGANAELVKAIGIIGSNRVRRAVSGSRSRGASHESVMPRATPNATASATMPIIPRRPDEPWYSPKVPAGRG